MSKPLLALNVLVGAVAVFLSAEIVWLLSTTPALPPPPTARPLQPTPHHRDASLPVRQSSGSYDDVVAKNLFSASRSEGAAPAAPLVSAAKPVLHGVVIGAETGLAYLEDPVSKRVSSYKAGDAVAGGQLERIEPDRVVIKRSEGMLEVMLRDPSKPRLPVSQPPPGETKPAPTTQPSVAVLESPAPNPTATYRAAPRGHPQWGGPFR